MLRRELDPRPARAGFACDKALSEPGPQGPRVFVFAVAARWPTGWANPARKGRG
ncbi:hypothetical protein VT84_05550 [Gemmata sp. SH-PL17]|nr:hypothetical protein VT84_05550 [Gemmata sp. SH-PL17]